MFKGIRLFAVLIVLLALVWTLRLAWKWGSSQVPWPGGGGVGPWDNTVYPEDLPGLEVSVYGTAFIARSYLEPENLTFAVAVPKKRAVVHEFQRFGEDVGNPPVQFQFRNRGAEEVKFYFYGTPVLRQCLKTEIPVVLGPGERKEFAFEGHGIWFAQVAKESVEERAPKKAALFTKAPWMGLR
jgi:hypothetical protein